MISPLRPSSTRIETYRAARVDRAPSHPSTAGPADGYRVDRFARVLGSGQSAFEASRSGVTQWVQHRGSGVGIHPTDAGLAEGDTVAVVMRQLGLWVVAACRIESVVDEADTFGFTYATLPGHPVRGYESFLVRREGDEVRFEIEAVSQPASITVRIAPPVGRILQRQITNRYLDALQRHVAESAAPA